jgi:rhomboid protease GluP
VDLNVVLLPGLILGAAFGGYRATRVMGRRGRGWIAIHAAVGLLGLASLLTGWVHGGLVTLGAWIALLVVPSLVNLPLRRALETDRFAAAERWAWIGRLLHPMDGTREVLALVRASRLADAGALEDAQAILREVEALASPLAINARLQRLQLLGAWAEMESYVAGLPPEVREPNHAAVVAWVRAPGELGEPETVLTRYAHATRLHQIHTLRPVMASLQLSALACCGRVEALERALDGTHLGPEQRGLWRARGLAAAGRGEESQEILQRLLGSKHASVRLSAQRGLAAPAAPVEVSALGPESQVILRDLEASALEASTVGQLMRPARRATPATWTLMALLAAAYGVQVLLGATHDAAALYDLGAAYTPIGDPRFAWWRVLSAGWLHFGALHLSANAFALLLFGRFVEAALSSARMLVIYLVGGAAGLGVAVALMSALNDAPDLLVGASGSVMALVGAGLAVVWSSWRRVPAPESRARLMEVAMIVGFQVMVDTMTPQVSLLAHAGGALAGFLLGLALIRRPTP